MLNLSLFILIVQIFFYNSFGYSKSCDILKKRSKGGFAVKFESCHIYLNKISKLVIELASQDHVRSKLSFDAEMPEHGHGMPTVATVSHRGNGVFLIDKLLFSMPGLWVLHFDVKNESGLLQRSSYEIYISAYQFS